MLACAPARIPVYVGSTQANLLLPIYVVVAGRRSRSRGSSSGEESARASSARSRGRSRCFVGWTGLTLLWSQDVRQGAIELLFFVLPFGLLAVALARLPWSRGWVLTLYVQLAGMALVFAAIGICQYVTRNIFWNPKVIVDNAYAPSGWFYRVNSVFYDPSIYGRFLVVAILASLVVVLFGAGGPARGRIAGGVATGITWARARCRRSRSRASSRSSPGSSSALVVALAAAGGRAARWSRSRRCSVVAVGVPAGAPPRRRQGRRCRTRRAAARSSSRTASSSSRTTRWSASASAASGALRGARPHLKGKEPKAAASHTTPITVAAETGPAGLRAARLARRSSALVVAVPAEPGRDRRPGARVSPSD